MATITGLTAARMLEIEAASVVDGDVVGDDLFLTTHDGTLINAGNVRGPVGPEGPQGSSLDVITAEPVLNVGIANQIRAGRQLTALDFTNMGLDVPLALWNLSNFTDQSGNGHTLTNKGGVTQAPGINGVAGTAAQFTGNTAKALYIPDAGAGDPFRIHSISVGCWFRTSKKNTYQELVSKWSAGTGIWLFQIMDTNVIRFIAQTVTGSTGSVILAGSDDVVDGRWHFAMCTYDGDRAQMMLDGQLVASAPNLTVPGPLFSGAAPLNIGIQQADAAAAGVNPLYGRIDEAFITPQVLTEDQFRNLYAASIPHTLGAVPKSVSMSIRRRRHAEAVVADFPAQPQRLYAGGSLVDLGSDGVNLVANNAPPKTAGLAGGNDKAYSFLATSTQYLSATDAGLPAGTDAVTMGCWFRCTTAGGALVLMNYGAAASNERLLYINSGTVRVYEGVPGDRVIGPFLADGKLHFVAMVVDPAPDDGQIFKLYVEGRLYLGSAAAQTGVGLGGANKFRVGARINDTQHFTGQIMMPFVYDGALTPEQIESIYFVGGQELAVSPSEASNHIEAMEPARLLAIFDSLEGVNAVDLAVTA